MTVDIAITLFLLLAVIVLFSIGRMSVDIVCWLLLATLVVTGVASPAQVFSGFASEIVVVLASVFVIVGALIEAGVMNWLAELVRRVARRSEARMVAVLMSLAAVLSAVFSNTSATAVMLPAVTQLSRRSKIAASRLLMPLAFASILGGSCTLIGTSTNLASSSLISALGLAPYSMFEFVIIGTAVSLVGIGYMVLVGRRMLPADTSELAARYELPEYLSELIIPAQSAAVGESLSQLRLQQKQITPLLLVRGAARLTPHHRRKLQAGDKLVVKAGREALLKFLDSPRFGIEAARTLGTEELSSGQAGIAEAVLTTQSRLLGKSLRQHRFHDRYQVAVLAIRRGDHTYPAQIENMRLRAGDVLLLHGEREALEALQGNRDLWGLMTIAAPTVTYRQGLLTIAGLIAAIALAVTGILPLSIAMLLAALSLVLVGTISAEQAYRHIDWRLLVLIAGMTSFGVVMQSTGTASYLADKIVAVTLPFGAIATLAAFGVVTVVLTQPMSNAAAALVLLPMAISAAELLQLNPRTFAVMVTLSASLSFITPFEPASLLVWGPGNYRFRDYLIVGLPLTALVIGMLLWLVPVVWPLAG